MKAVPGRRATTLIDTEALKRERPLADVVAACGVALRRESAGTFRGLCPFHTERTPSFWIDARDGTMNITGVSAAQPRGTSSSS